jgi:hypothetical protein
MRSCQHQPFFDSLGQRWISRLKDSRGELVPLRVKVGRCPGFRSCHQRIEPEDGSAVADDNAGSILELNRLRVVASHARVSVGNAHQVPEKTNAAYIRRLRRGELCISAASRLKPLTTVLSKSVGRAFALS